MDTDSSPKASPVASGSFEVSATKDPAEACAETPPNKNEKTLQLMTSFFDQLYKNPTALASFLAVLKQQLNRPPSAQPQKPKEIPAKQPQKKSRKKSASNLQQQQQQQQSQQQQHHHILQQHNQGGTEAAKISHSRSWETTPIRTKEPPLKSCYEKRQKIILKQIRRIQTPDFVSYDSLPEIFPGDAKIVPVVDFDLLKNHLRLEVCESRIIQGVDEKFLHPAYAVKAADIYGELDLTEREEKRSMNYQLVEVKQQTPLFWPSRVWDKPETMMAQSSNDRLFEDVNRITEITQSLDLGRFVHSRPPSTGPRMKRTNSSRANRSRTNSRRPKDSIIDISFSGYLTDDCSDFTDIEDF